MKSIAVKKLHKDATLPTRAYEHDAGLDLYAAEDISYRASDTFILVPTHISLSIEPGYVGVIADRSSFSKLELKVTAGILDAGYKGDVKVAFLNVGANHGHIAKGTKIAQVMILPVVLPKVVEVTQMLDNTDRGTKGWGSSDV